MSASIWAGISPPCGQRFVSGAARMQRACPCTRVLVPKVLRCHCKVLAQAALHLPRDFPVILVPTKQTLRPVTSASWARFQCLLEEDEGRSTHDLHILSIKDTQMSGVLRNIGHASLEVTSPSFRSFTSFLTLSGLPLAFQLPPHLEYRQKEDCCVRGRQVRLRVRPTMNFLPASSATRSALAARFVGPTNALQRPKAATTSASSVPDKEWPSFQRHGLDCTWIHASEMPGRRDIATALRATEREDCRAKLACVQKRNMRGRLVQAMSYKPFHMSKTIAMTIPAKKPR